MAKEYIEREAVVKELEEHLSYEYPGFTKEQNECIDTGLKIARRSVKALPAADVVEVKHGRWIPDDKFPSGKSSIFHCSECYYTRTTSVLYTAEKLSQDDPYCKNCGAKMDGTTEDKENENHG